MLDAVASTFGSILTFQIFCYTFAIYQDEWDCLFVFVFAQLADGRTILFLTYCYNAGIAVL